MAKEKLICTRMCRFINKNCTDTLNDKLKKTTMYLVPDLLLRSSVGERGVPNTKYKFIMNCSECSISCLNLLLDIVRGQQQSWKSNGTMQPQWQNWQEEENSHSHRLCNTWQKQRVPRFIYINMKVLWINLYQYLPDEGIADRLELTCALIHFLRSIYSLVMRWKPNYLNIQAGNNFIFENWTKRVCNKHQNDSYLIIRKLHTWFDMSYWYELYIYMNIEWIVSFSHQIIQLYEMCIIEKWDDTLKIVDACTGTYNACHQFSPHADKLKIILQGYMESEIIFLPGRLRTNKKNLQGGRWNIFCHPGGRHIFLE